MSRKKSRSEVDYLFVPAPHALILDVSVSHPACRLWELLHILAWLRESPDPERLQELMGGAGERSIYRWLKELEVAGWLEWNRNRYDLDHRFLLKAGGSGEAATMALVRAALDGSASIEDIRRIVESADAMRETPIDEQQTFATDGKSDPSGKTDPVGKSATRIKSSATRISTFVTDGKSQADLGLSDGVNRPSSEDQNHENHVGVGVGAAPAENLASELDRRGLNPTTVQTILSYGLDPMTVLQSFDNMLADGEAARQDLDKVRGLFVLRLRHTPPQKGAPYERRIRPVQPDASPDRARGSFARAEGAAQNGQPGRHGPTGGSDLRDPGWRERLIADAQARAHAVGDATDLDADV